MRVSLVVPIALCASVLALSASAVQARPVSHHTAPVAVVSVVKAKVERTAHRVARKVSRAAHAARARTAHAFHVAGRKVRHAAHVVDAKASAKARALKRKVRRALRS